MIEWKDEDSGLTWKVNKEEGRHDISSAEELEEENPGWRIPSMSDWLTLVRGDFTFKDSVPFKDNDIYWTCNLYMYNPVQKMIIAEFTFDRLDFAFTSRTNPQSVRLVKG